MLLGSVLQGDELTEHRQKDIATLTAFLGDAIFMYAVCEGGINSDEKKRAYHKGIKLLELMYEDSDFGFYAFRIAANYFYLAYRAATNQNKDETLNYLANAVKYRIIDDTQEDFKHTSLFVNRLHYSRENYGVSNESHIMLENMESNCFDFCRDDERFVKLIEDLKQVTMSEK